MLIFIGCGGGSDGNNSPQKSRSFNLIPSTGDIAIAQNARIILKGIYTDKNGNIIEQKEEDNLSIKYTIKDTSIASITKAGFLSGLKSGTTTIVASLTDNGKTYSSTRKLRVELVILESLHLNPSIATFEAEENVKDFTITGTEKDNSPLKLFEESISLKIDKPDLISVVKNFSNDVSKLVITAKNPNRNNFDYTFITPIYKQSGITVQGSPSLIQFKATAQPNSPDGSEGGKHISFLTTKDSSGKNIFHATHSDGTKKIYYQRFDGGSWTYTALSPEGVFDIRDTKMVEVGNALYIIASTSKGIWWAITDLSLSSVEFFEEFIIKDVDAKNINIEVIDNKAYMSYYDEKNQSLVLANISTNGKVSKQVLSVNKDIIDFDMSLNVNNKIRMVMYDKKAVYYITNQNNKFYQESVFEGENIKNLKLLFDRYNKPYVLFSQNSFSSNSIRIYSKGKVGFRAGVWKSKRITKETFSSAGIRDEYSPFSLDAITSIDAHFDFLNALRVVVGEDRDVYYLKEYLLTSSTSSWRVDKIATKAGASSIATTLDSRNRLHIMYTYDTNNWMKLWGEPVSIDYGDKVAKNSTTIDTIEETEENLLK
jgi:hypothetical protein